MRRSPPRGPSGRPAPLPRRLGAVLLAAGLACAGARARPGAPPGPAGGAHVDLPAPGHPTVAVRLQFRAGAADDPPGQEGITRLAALLMAQGGTRSLDPAALQRALYPMAAELEVIVDKETVTFAGRCPAADLERFLPILEEVVLAPRLDPTAFERLRRQALDEVQKTLRTEDDEALAKEALALQLYAGHPYGHPDQGTVTALRRLTLDEVRAHGARVFVRSRLTVGAAGGYPGALAARVAGDLAALPAGGPPGPVPPPPADPHPRFLLVEKPSTPTAISLGFTWDLRRGDPDFPALVVAVSALGEHRQGGAFRLFHDLREVRGLNYGDYAYPEHFVQAGDSALPEPNHARTWQEFTVWIRPVEPQHRAFAVRAALWEVDRWAREGLTAQELEATKEFLAGYTLGFAQSDQRRLGYALDDLFYGLPRPWLTTFRARLPSLTLAEVNAALRRHVDPARLRVAVATRGAAELAAEIRSGDPSPISYPTPKPPEVLAQDRAIAIFPYGLRGPDDVKVVGVETLFER